MTYVFLPPTIATGDLPTLPSPTKSPGKPSFNAINSLTNSSLSDVDRALALSEHVQSQHQWRPSGNHNSLLGGGGQNAPQPSRKADSKNKKKKTSPEDEVPKDMPREFLCQLTQVCGDDCIVVSIFIPFFSLSLSVPCPNRWRRCTAMCTIERPSWTGSALRERYALSQVGLMVMCAANVCCGVCIF
jgi:hypothetical protein